MTVICFMSFTILLICLCVCVRLGLKLILERRKLILNNSISEADDLFTNIASMIPTGDEVNLLERKAQVYLKYIKRDFRNRFIWSIDFMTCGSVPERFGVPLVSDWISNIGKISDIHALVSDQDFLIEPFGITASYSAQPHTVEIVQSESYIEEGYAKLRVSRWLARPFNLKEGFLSTTTVKELVIRCISKVSVTKFLGLLSRIDQVPWLGRLAKLLFGKLVKIHGPAIKLHITYSNGDSIFLADFTFAIPCLEWPPESDWPLRNKMWPDHRVVTTIKDRGFHLVPVNQKNDKSKLTWRYSFSLAERELSKQVNEIARKCFLCVKIISADHLKPICKKLSSYHLKTVLFRTLEVTSAEMWSEINILTCLDYLLKELQEAFHQQKCLHFWMSHINLFQHFNHHELSELEVKVKDIRKNPFPFLFTYSFVIRPSCLQFKKNEKELFCLCCGFLRDDCTTKLKIKKSNISEEAAAEEGNCVQVSPEEEAALNIDSYPVCGSFSQEENL